MSQNYSVIIPPGSGGGGGSRCCKDGWDKAVHPRCCRVRHLGVKGTVA
jgi:hypothetical protein